jgi:hypothetical protein
MSSSNKEISDPPSGLSEEQVPYLESGNSLIYYGQPPESDIRFTYHDDNDDESETQVPSQFLQTSTYTREMSKTRPIMARTTSTGPSRASPPLQLNQQPGTRVSYFENILTALSPLPGLVSTPIPHRSLTPQLKTPPLVQPPPPLALHTPRNRTPRGSPTLNNSTYCTPPIHTATPRASPVLNEPPPSPPAACNKCKSTESAKQCFGPDCTKIRCAKCVVTICKRNNLEQLNDEDGDLIHVCTKVSLHFWCIVLFPSISYML